MPHFLEERIYHRKMTRRDFLWLTSVSTASVVVTGCAINPVTGKPQLMLMSENQEIQLDKEHSPHQFSTDYGPLQDQPLNDYISEVGHKMADFSHRPQMPYSFRGVNATYVNAYAFPGGSIAATRGILIALQNEAELAALLGHELGHVNARHTASRMSKGMLIGVGLALGTAVVSTSEKYGQLAQLAVLLGQFGAGLLLAHYSRDDERQADALGMQYMTKAGHSPEGMVGLMELLNTISKHKPSVVETMFATHPMSSERYQTAMTAADTTYQSMKTLPVNRDRYMEKTAKLRRDKKAIEAMQQGETKMATEQFRPASRQFKKALKHAPNDYTALAMMTKCQLAQEKPNEARQYAMQAKQVYPAEAQAHHLNGIANMMKNQFDAAYQDFDTYEQMLPGNPNTVFLKGTVLEGMQNKPAAAAEYNRYLKMSRQGGQAEYAAQRLTDWGYMKPPPKRK
ncbi:MAG: peptidase M48 Ste24p [Candidatus Parabeggiatoa sp. nov. 1]|nr:MAG: peptidase M48 Ste24p [Gammaproteobacteria bacterium]HEC85991.1 peptidase M48 Ste24p [Thioploca sp.]